LCQSASSAHGRVQVGVAVVGAAVGRRVGRGDGCGVVLVESGGTKGVGAGTGDAVGVRSAHAHEHAREASEARLPPLM